MFNGAPEEQRAAAEKLNTLYDFRRWKPHVGKTMPLAEAAEAHRVSESRHLRGKLVLTMH